MKGIIFVWTETANQSFVFELGNSIFEKCKCQVLEHFNFRWKLFSYRISELFSKKIIKNLRQCRAKPIIWLIENFQYRLMIRNCNTAAFRHVDFSETLFWMHKMHLSIAMPEPFTLTLHFSPLPDILRLPLPVFRYVYSRIRVNSYIFMCKQTDGFLSKFTYIIYSHILYMKIFYIPRTKFLSVE